VPDPLQELPRLVQARLERRLPLLDALVVDLGDRGGVTPAPPLSLEQSKIDCPSRV
jgi:hypothetical protein